MAQQGYNAMMNVQHARAALFNGQPDQAQKLAKEAQNCFLPTALTGASLLKQTKPPHWLVITM
ncbi:YfdX family protein [Plesiomonas shigelloides]|nr:YfdX family protein [Plesiomonas shigelloides]